MLSGDKGAHLEKLSGRLNEVIGVNYLEQGRMHGRDSEIAASAISLLLCYKIQRVCSS